MWKHVTEYFRLVMEGRRHGWFASILCAFFIPFSFLYRICQLAVKSFDSLPLVRRELPIPVMSVGNLTWGGTGKTPLVEKLARYFSDRNKSVLILRRGYGEDETLLLKKHLNYAHIAIGKDRFNSGMSALQDGLFDVALLDDGFQQWKLKHDVDVVTIDALNPFGNRHLLPAGILREPLSALKRANVIVITHAHELAPHALERLKMVLREYISNDTEIFTASLGPVDFLQGRTSVAMPLEFMRGRVVVAYSAVGNPMSFWKLLDKLGLRVIRRFEFRDHYKLTHDDISAIRKEKERSGAFGIVTTEKDFLRQPGDLITEFDPIVLRVEVCLEDEEQFRKKVFALLYD